MSIPSFPAAHIATCISRWPPAVERMLMGMCANPLISGRVGREPLLLQG